MYTDLFKNKFKDPCPGSYYIYLHRRATDLSVFYVGKGIGRRGWRYKNRSPYWKNVAYKNGVIVDVTETGLAENDAFFKEKKVIQEYRDEGVLLTNMTDGGDGKKGLSPSKETKARMSRSHGGKTVYCSNGMSFNGHSEAVAWLKENTSFNKARPTNIGKCCRGEEGRASAYGFTWYYDGVPYFNGGWSDNVRKSRSVRVMRSDGVIFESVTDAANKTGLNNISGISGCINGKLKSSGGYKWFKA